MTTGIDLVLMWHMHQPDYRIGGDGGEREFALPWTYLHAIKDYADMAAHLERHGQMRAVVNFVPVLLEQIEDYADQFYGGQFRDPLLRCLARPDLDDMPFGQRRLLLDTCFLGNHGTMLEPYPDYANLHRIFLQVAESGEAGIRYLSGNYFSDLVTWYHLAWCGETERRRQPLLARLLAKGSGFDAQDRNALLDLIGKLISGLISRYRALGEDGRIELATSPHAHPLAPLLIDLSCARQSQPNAPLPRAQRYPGGRTRVLAHMERAFQSHEARFGASPAGLWPAEGAVSDDLVRLLATHECGWAASSESVLANSLRRQNIDFRAQRDRHLYQPWRLFGAAGTTLFFRDERLSDLIGFEYSNWHGSDAARHFIGELEAIGARAGPGERPLVSVILDGENAWEYYPYNGYYFLDHLYEELGAHPTIRMTTYSEVIARRAPHASLDALTAGSWVHGTLATWIGNPEKNRAWDLLCAAKRSYDLAVTSGRLDAEQLAAADHQLARCESSDWFWWFGSGNSRTSIETFDDLFRRNLAQLYALLDLRPPPTLDHPINPPGEHGREGAHGGTMLRGQADPNGISGAASP